MSRAESAPAPVTSVSCSATCSTTALAAWRTLRAKESTSNATAATAETPATLVTLDTECAVGRRIAPEPEARLRPSADSSPLVGGRSELALPALGAGCPPRAIRPATSPANHWASPPNCPPEASCALGASAPAGPPAALPQGLRRAPLPDQPARFRHPRTRPAPEARRRSRRLGRGSLPPERASLAPAHPGRTPPGKGPGSPPGCATCENCGPR
eukprot:11294585-Alexandrium_andersonii.AAC.1